MSDAIDEQFVATRADTASVEIDGEIVLAAPVGDHVYTHWLDRVATVVWNSFDGTSTLRAVAEDLSAAFDADGATIRKDVLELARALGRRGLLAGIDAEPPREPRSNPIESLQIGTQTDFAGPAVLVHWSPACGFCASIAGDLAALQPRLREHGTELVLIAHGTEGANRSLLEESGLECRIVLDEQSPVFAGLGTPCAYRVDRDGRVSSYLAIGADLVLAIARHEARGRG